MAHRSFSFLFTTFCLVSNAAAVEEACVSKNECTTSACYKKCFEDQKARTKAAKTKCDAFCCYVSDSMNGCESGCAHPSTRAEADDWCAQSNDACVGCGATWCGSDGTTTTTTTTSTTTTDPLPVCRMSEEWKTRHNGKDRQCGYLTTKNIQNKLCKKTFTKNNKQVTGFQACPQCVVRSGYDDDDDHHQTPQDDYHRGGGDDNYRNRDCDDDHNEHRGG